MAKLTIGEGWRRLRIVMSVIVAVPLTILWAWVVYPGDLIPPPIWRETFEMAAFGLVVVCLAVFATWLLITAIGWVVAGFRQQ